MAGMTCKCCREWVDFATFAEVNSGKCGDCSTDHDPRHPSGWIEAARSET